MEPDERAAGRQAATRKPLRGRESRRTGI